GVLFDDFVFARQDGRPLDFHVLHFKAEFLRALEMVVNVGMVQKNFGRDAAYMEARAAERGFLLDDNRLQSPLCSANRGHVAARSAPDDREVVFSQTGSPLRLVFPPELIDAWKGGYDCDSSKCAEERVYQPYPAAATLASAGIGRDHRIPLAELACMSPKRRQELADRLGGKPGRAPRIKYAHVRRPVFRPGP